MNLLQKELKFKQNTTITERELVDLVNELMNIEWEIKFRKETQIINLKKLGWNFNFHNKKRSMGTCSFRKKLILLSRYYFEANPDKSRDWEDVIRHEIAHALDRVTRGTSDHSYMWKRMAIQVLAKPNSTSMAFKCGNSRYLKVCPKCGDSQAAHQKRTPKDACVKCCNKYNHGRFSYEFVFKLEDNPEFATSVKPKLIIQPNPKTETIIGSDTKKCKDCGNVKSKSEFYKLKTSKDGLHTRCKCCYNEKRK